MGVRSADAAVKKEEFPVSTVSSNQLAPDISGSIVVWEDKRDGLSNIYGKNLSTGEEIQITTGATLQTTPEINGVKAS